MWNTLQTLHVQGFLPSQDNTARLAEDVSSERKRTNALY